MSTDKEKKSLADKSCDFFSSINKTCLRRIDRATVPIIGLQDDQIRHDRSGVLYRIADDYFVLTAAHCLHEIVKENIPLFLSMNKPGVMPLPLTGAKFHSTEDEGRDIAAIWLPPEIVREIVQHKEFLLHNQINFSGADNRGPFVFFGYPMHWSGHLIGDDYLASKGLAFATFPYDGPRLESSHYDPTLHMLLSFKRNAIDIQENCVEQLPELHGISGCGVWQVGDITDNGIKLRNEESVTLVAIQHRWASSSDYIMATKICYILSFITEMYPATQTAMNIVYPKQ